MTIAVTRVEHPADELRDTLTELREIDLGVQTVGEDEAGSLPCCSVDAVPTLGGRRDGAPRRARVVTRRPRPEDRLTVRHEDELDRKHAETFPQLRLELCSAHSCSPFGNQLTGNSTPPSTPTRRSPATSARCGSRKNSASTQSAPFDDLGVHSGRQLAFLLGSPQCRLVAIEHGCDAALVPVDGQQHVDRQAEPFDVTVERRPEPLVLVRRNERVDHDEGVRKLRIHGADLGAPMLRMVPLGMRRGPAPQPGPQLLNFHSCKTYPGSAGR